MPRAEADALPLKMWFFPWLSYTVEIGILAVLIAMMFVPGLTSQLFTTLLFVAVLWVIYFALKRGVAHSSAPVSRS